ncbi:FKBP-type peptidyl-prolyl cis-trans isomerase [Bdellovibrio svalbardensis]|uniref:Peptidyl-prolyl cis-trans isomerase n=1 Tax=Bdellovibrio svalbardensis TaxID=2972972 RepID=A0ABT6DK46_9BACT|nr:FKBP-type peptidyl-prolyl cis-trans isomerase [Bdellovibrio svalbardensis]MDG0817237.1 FKBP-type peptidyl-prolyl cis-trans isomerase [Bdellovibrio svalbardensis]
MNPQVISFNCILKDKTGKIISTTFNREVMTSIEGGGAMLSGLAEGLQNLKQGEKRLLHLPAEKAYGFYDPQKVILFPRSKLPKGSLLRVGETIIIVSKKGFKRSYRVLEIHSNFVSLDGNHPLAGQDLIFEIETISAREATPEEISESTNVLSTQYLN